MATGINVSKCNLYAVLAPPLGAGVSKANLYAVLSTPNATPPAWGSWSFPDGMVGVPYDQSWDMPLSAAVTYSVVAGALPDGLSLSATSGNAAHVHGTPTVEDTFTFTLRASSSAGTYDKVFSITIGASLAASARAHGSSW